MQEKKMKSRMKIELHYSEEKDGILNYIDKLFAEYLLSKELREQQILQTRQRYMEERTFLKQEIENYKEVSSALHIAIFMEQLSKELDVIVRSVIVQCPFIMFLLHLVSYNVLVEGFLEHVYLYKKMHIHIFDYYVESNFYESAKLYLEAFFKGTGYSYLWVGKTSCNFDDLRSPNGILILPLHKTAVDYKQYCGRLLDGSICILEEYVPNITRECRWYRFDKLSNLTITEEVLLDHYQSENKEDIINIFAYAAMCSPFGNSDTYYEEMIKKEYPIFIREDLWDYLKNAGVSEKRAYYWTEIICEGKLQRKRDKLSAKEELEGILSDDLIDLFCMMYCLPSRWYVFERYFQYKDRLGKGKGCPSDLSVVYRRKL